METNYRMCWSLYGEICPPINFPARSDEDAKEIVKKVNDFQKGIGLEGVSKITNLFKLLPQRKPKEIKNILP